jgi:hypothetical protein
LICQTNCIRCRRATKSQYQGTCRYIYHHHMHSVCST